MVPKRKTSKSFWKELGQAFKELVELLKMLFILFKKKVSNMISSEDKNNKQ